MSSPHVPAPSSQDFAVVSVGSSGIGLACATWLMRRGIPVLLLARRQAPLRDAAERLRGIARGVEVRIRAMDVTDAAACTQLRAELGASGPAPTWLVTAAGMAKPGRFLEQPLDDHRRHMEVNYFGTLNLVHALAPLMVGAGGRIVMISSGAALVGVAGYGAYGPSKFAVRGLAETLRVELVPHGISVTLAYPPDTDTPQWRDEREFRPPETAAISAAGGLATAGDVAGDIMTAAQHRRFVATTGRTMWALLWFHSLIAPVLRYQHARILRRFHRKTAALD